MALRSLDEIAPPISVKSPALGETYDCVSCGACCFGRRNYVQVFNHDAARLGAERMTELVADPVGEFPAGGGRAAEPTRYMKMTHGHCGALRIGNAQFLCSVYETRPTVCRALEPGSSACLEARARRNVVTPVVEPTPPARTGG